MGPLTVVCMARQRAFPTMTLWGERGKAEVSSANWKLRSTERRNWPKTPLYVSDRVRHRSQAF